MSEQVFIMVVKCVLQLLQWEGLAEEASLDSFHEWEFFEDTDVAQRINLVFIKFLALCSRGCTFFFS